MGVKKATWILITLLPLIVTIALSTKTKTGKTQMTTLSPQNATQEKNSNDTLDYGMNYYDYPAGLFLNETYNDTYGLAAYDNGYYGDYYGLYAYPELDAYYDEIVDNSTDDEIPTLMTTKRHEEGTKKPKPKRHEKGTKKPKPKRSKREPRSVPEESDIKHLCVINLLNVTNIFHKYIRYIVECKDDESKHFACLNSNGLIEHCYLLKDEKKPQVPLCIKKEKHSYVTICKSPEPRSFCFSDPGETNRIFLCNDKKHRVCFSGGLISCDKQEKKRVPREVVIPQKDQFRPDVNCSNCEVEIKMLVDEMVDNSPPKIQIKVFKLDSLELSMDSSEQSKDSSEQMMDAVDIDYDK